MQGLLIYQDFIARSREYEANAHQMAKACPDIMCLSRSLVMLARDPCQQSPGQDITLITESNVSMVEMI